LKITNVPFTDHDVTYVKAVMDSPVGFFVPWNFFTNGKCRKDIKSFLETYGTRIAGAVEGNQCQELERIKEEIQQLVDAAETALQDADQDDAVKGGSC
jgi:hypothetical protein